MDRLGVDRGGLGPAAGVGWAGLDLVGAGWAGLDLVGAGWAGLDLVGASWAGLDLVELLCAQWTL